MDDYWAAPSGVPQAAPQDIEEYERLLSQRFSVDPNIPGNARTPPHAVAAPSPAPDNREARLAELQRKLFGAP